MEVVYLCDRRDKCKGCSTECKHTSNIEHAKNFEKFESMEGDVYFEKETDINKVALFLIAIASSALTTLVLQII